MAKRGGIGGFGGGALEHLRQWLGSQWPGPALGVPSCLEALGAHRGGITAGAELGRCQGGTLSMLPCGCSHRMKVRRCSLRHSFAPAPLAGQGFGRGGVYSCPKQEGEARTLVCESCSSRPSRPARGLLALGLEPCVAYGQR